MFPGVNGFHWTVGHVLFVTIFASVMLVIASTAIAAMLRARRDVRSGRLEPIRWHADWEDLPERDRRCRHDIAGEVIYRVCPHGFDCRGCGDHPRFGGTDAAATRYYHRGHTWVEIQEDGTAIVGLDEIGRRLIGRPEIVQLPPPGAALVTNGIGWRMSKHGVEVRILAPIDGEVIETGGPDDDWYLRIRPSTNPPDLRHLLRGSEVSAWVRRELERLQLLFTPEGAHPSLADGGELMHDLIAQQPTAKWDRIVGAVFLDP
jgi:hypothetical protein